jgi:hypothetical protein
VFLRFRRHPNVRQALLRLRAEHLADGPEAEVIDLRLHLREQMEAARRAVASIGSAGELAGELPAVFQQLERAADRLDHYLQVLERSVADGGSYRSLGQARRRVAEVVTAARDVRRAALATLDVTATGEIQAIRRAVEEEVTWVQSAVEAMDDLSGPERTPGRSGPSSSGGYRRGERSRRR